MAITVKHKFVSAIPDAGDTTIVQPSNWNDDHQLSGTVPPTNGGTGASTLTGYVKGNGTSTMTANATIPNTDITGLGTASTKDAGVANGVATLDGSGTVPISQLPAAVIGALSYQGTWNASTNTPTLTSSVGTKGYYYVVNVAGSTNLNGITDWQVGDWAVYNGSAWQKIDNTDAVTSVNGYTGTVVLGYGDITTGVVPIANGGTNSTATPTAGGVGYGTGTAHAYSSVGTSGQFLQSNGSSTPTWANITSNVGSVGYYGAFYDTTATQTASSTTTAYQVLCGSTASSNGISLASNAVTFTNAGKYLYAFSLQILNPNSSISTVTIWFKVNGVDLPDSAGTYGVPAKHGSINGLSIVGWEQLLILNAGDVVTMYWQADVVGTRIETLPAGTSPVLPESPAVAINTYSLAQVGIGYYNETSATSTLIGTGSKTFTVTIPATSTAFTVGTRVRVAYAITPSNFMEGVITAFTTTSMTVNVDAIGGSGTYANWTISVAGIAGSNGVTSLAAGTGISLSGSTGAVTVTNTAPDQTVAIASGTGISVTGTYPSFTVTNTSPSSGGTVTSVTATAPVASTGGTTPVISMPVATSSVNGYLSSTDWTTFNNKGSGTVTSVSGTTGRITSTGGTTPVIDLASGVATAGTTGSSTLIPVVTIDTYGRVTSITTASNPQGTVTSVTGTAPVVSSGGATPAISMAAANTTTNGYLTSTDWNTFNGKGSGTVTSVTATSPVTSTGGTNPVIAMAAATSSVNGYLTSTDWTTFNNKANSFTYTTNYISYGQGTTTPNQASNFTFDGTTQSAPIQRASNGIYTNTKAIATNFTIPSTDNAMSSGPITINSGITVTVSSGSRWVVL